MPKPFALILIGTFLVNAHAAKFDPPDLNLEFQLHRQYQVLKGEATSSPQGKLESYELQQGESLWGLSQMLYGDGNYWPKVWAQNQSITNPHLIRPGHTLQFIMGSEDTTPQFRFSEPEDTGPELAAARENSNPQIEIPPPETPPRPVINVPSSFPEWQSVYRKRPDHFEIDDSKMLIKRHVPADRIPLTAYVQENEVDSIGTFLEPEKESGLPVPNQYVYVKLNKGVGKIGQKLLIVKDHGKIRKLNSQVEGKINARFIQIFGDMEIVDTAQSNFSRKSDSEHFDIFRALILHAYSLTLTTFDLIPGQIEIIDLKNAGPGGTTTAQVIGSMKHVASALYGAGDIVFLNKGSQDGITPGQILNIYIDRSIRDEGTSVTFSTMSSGVVKIAKVSTTCSTAVILSSSDSIQQGDRVGQWLSQSGAKAPSEGGDLGGGELPQDEGAPPLPPEAEPGSGSDFDLPE